MVPNTSELLPEPETRVNTVSRRFGISTLMSLRLFTRAPWTRIRSWGSELTSLEAARGLCRPGWSGRCLTGELPLLEDPDRVAEGVADAQVGAVEVVGGLLGEVGDAPRLEGLVQTPDVVRLEHEPAQRALRDQLAELRGGGFVMHRRARLLEGDLGDVARDAHRQPAVGTLLDILALLQPELVDVEVKSLVLVEDHDGGDVEFGDHRSFSPLRDLMGMTLMLGGRRCGGVSKTARSHLHPRRHHGPHGPQLEAVGRHHRPMPHAVLRRRLADDLSKRAAEGPPAGEADVEADVGDAAVGLTQEEHRPLHPPPLQVTVRRLPEDGAEAADEVSLGDMGHRGHGADVKRFGVSAVHGIAGAQQPPVELFDFPAHGSTLRDQGAWLTTSSSAGSRRRRRRPSAGAALTRNSAGRCSRDLIPCWSRFGVDERLQLLDVRFVEVSEKGQVVRTVDEPYRQHHVPLEETIGPYHNTDQRATVKQDIVDPAEPVTAVAEHDIFSAVNLDLAFPLVGNFVKRGHCDTTDSTGQDRLLFERCLPHGRRPGPIAEVERLTTDVGPRHRKSDEIMGGRNDGCDRDYNLVRDEERLGST